MSDYYILITDAGAALEASAHAAGTTVKLAKFGVCDGGVDFIPDPAATTFANEVFQSDISSLTVSADDATVMVAQCIIPGSSGGYTIRGIAIYADDGTLYATGSYPAQPKPAPDSGFAASLEILAQLAVSDTADVSLAVTEGNFLTETQGNTLYLRQDKRFSEIAAAGAEAQSAARKNIALGTVATLDATTSTTDNTVGHVLKVGDHGVGNCAILAEDAALNAANGSGYPSGFFIQDNGDGDSRYGDFGAGVNLLYADTPGEGGGTFYGRTFVRRDGHCFAEWLQVNPDGTFAAQFINELYGTLNKPTATDTGALPIYPTPLSVDLNTLGATESAGIYSQDYDLNAKLELNYPTTQSGTLLVTPTAYGCMQEYTTFGSGQKFVRGLTSTFNGSGPWGNWIPQYSPSNPPPATDLSAYATQQWVTSYFVQSFQFGAVTQVAVSGNQYAASTGCVLSAIQDYDTGNYPSFDSVDAVYQKPAQIMINGVWLTVAG